jgi:hypothetical protein
MNELMQLVSLISVCMLIAPGCTVASEPEGESNGADDPAVVTARAVSALLADGSMVAEDYLFQGQRLNAPNCYYHLDMQTDGNLVAYKQGQVPIWQTHTYVNPYSPEGFFARLQTDGNFVVYSSAARPLWNSHTNGVGASAKLRMQDDGNVVIYSGSPLQARWNSGTYQQTLAFPCNSVPKSDVSHVFSNLMAIGTSLGLPFEDTYLSGCGIVCVNKTGCVGFNSTAPNPSVAGRCTLLSAITGFQATPNVLAGIRQIQ